ncbi:MAG: SH3 domain-containing protein, partial [Clostridia bacterium]|nr:SH3 domain-containing protein [Clostridia bacterium]
KLSSASSKLNVREQASTSSAVLTQVKHGTAVQVLAVDGDWAQISVNGVTGYVMTKYLAKTESTPEPEVTATPEVTPEASVPTTTQSATIKLSSAGSKLNVRAQASTSSAVLTQVKHGTAVQVLAVDGDWSQISVNGVTGYVMTKYLQRAGAEAAPKPTGTPEPTARPSGGLGTYDILFEAQATANVNMRDSASMASDVIARVPKGATVEVVDYNDEWCYALYGEYEGFIAVRYLKKSS